MSGLLAVRLGPSLVRRLVTSKAYYRPATLMTLRKLSIRNLFKKDVTTIDEKPDLMKTEYEIELEKFTKKENYRKFYGFHQHDPGIDKIYYQVLAVTFFTLCLGFLPIIMIYSPDFNGRMVLWRKREAVMQIEQRTAEGKLLIEPDYVPPHLIEEMVPPPGDWEEEWLRNQASAITYSPSKAFLQVLY